MGYYASFDGAIALSGEADHEKILESAESVFYENCNITDYTETGFFLYIGGYDRYRDDDIYAFLDEVTPYTVYGEITYVGDDNSNWRHIFEQEKKQWVEQNGRIEYEKAGTSVADCMKLNKLLRLKYRNDSEKEAADAGIDR